MQYFQLKLITSFAVFRLVVTALLAQVGDTTHVAQGLSRQLLHC
jgi:hypothetical protein